MISGPAVGLLDRLDEQLSIAEQGARDRIARREQIDRIAQAQRTARDLREILTGRRRN